MQGYIEAQNSPRIMAGIGCLVLAGLLFVIALPFRGPLIDPATDAAGYARAANSGAFVAAWIVITIGLFLEILGYLGLYALLAKGAGSNERFAFWGLILSVIGTVMSISPLGFAPFGAPEVAKLYLSGQTSAIQVATASLAQPPALIFLIVSGVLFVIGSVLFGIAIWRSGTLPRWAAIPYVLQAPLVSFAPQVSFVAEIIGNVLLLMAAAWIAWAAWQESSAPSAATLQAAPPRA